MGEVILPRALGRARGKGIKDYTIFDLGKLKMRDEDVLTLARTAPHARCNVLLYSWSVAKGLLQCLYHPRAELLLERDQKMKLPEQWDFVQQHNLMLSGIHIVPCGTRLAARL